MTEDEWLRTDDFTRMLNFMVRDRAAHQQPGGLRKFQLLACAICRSRWDALTDPRSRHAVDVAERQADGRAAPEEVDDARFQALAASRDLWNHWRGRLQFDAEMQFVNCAASLLDPQAAPFARVCCEGRSERHTNAFRCIFGNPFRPVAAAGWRSPNAVALAASIYEDRAYDRLPILADALEDAGCDATDVLNHLRDGGEHVRGCWAVDRVLGNG